MPDVNLVFLTYLRLIMVIISNHNIFGFGLITFCLVNIKKFVLFLLTNLIILFSSAIFADFYYDNPSKLTTPNTKIVHILSGYGGGHSCIGSFIQNNLDQLDYSVLNFLINIDRTKINSIIEYQRYSVRLITLIKSLSPDVILFYDFYISDDLYDYILYQFNGQYNSLGTEYTDSIRLEYDFKTLFEFMNKLNLNYDSTVYYIRNVYSEVLSPKSDNIYRNLKQFIETEYSSFELQEIRVKSDYELQQFLMKLNKSSENLAMLFFNLDYLVSHSTHEILTHDDIVNIIQVYNLRHIPINLNSLCGQLSELMTINLVFDLDLNNYLLNTGQNFGQNPNIIKSGIAIRLNDFHKLNLLYNISHETLYNVFSDIDQIR